ncbi:MAG: aconitate hydratase [Thermovirgaceae bacterium]
MGLTVFGKILKAHLVEGSMKKGEPVALRMDQTLTQDATGTMACLEFEAIGIPRVRTELSVSYVDHNMIQGDYKNPDDHRFLQDFASRYGIIFSRPGNGICHHVHLERFARPGKTLIGSDSHTPTAGGVGMIAIGAGGLDVALAMAGEPFTITMPEVVRVHLAGKLQPFVSAKDVILEILRRISVKGGVGKVLEYAGPGIASLNVPERATMTNMGAETGASTSIFPSDGVTRRWLRAQAREYQWAPIEADPDASYDDILEIDLSRVEPMVAKPFQPDNVVPVSEIEGTPVDQVMFGSCTNSSLRDIMAVHHILAGRTIHPRVDAGISPGSRQVLLESASAGTLDGFIASGVRILESSCGACIGMGFAPPTDGVSLRTINRNFLGRCGHASGKVYLVSPEVAAASAITGEITDPRSLGIEPWVFEMPEQFLIDDSMLLAPSAEPEKIRIRRGPNIAALPEMPPLPEKIKGEVLLKVEDNITTDHIIPGGAGILPLRSNIPEISKHTFEVLDRTFPDRALEKGGGFIIGGENYGQGSSREHAAIAPRYLGVTAVIAKSFARIHLANLVNFGILPLVFENAEDYGSIRQGDRLSFETHALAEGKLLEIMNESEGRSIPVRSPVTEKDLQIIRAGGRLSYIKRSKAAAKNRH